MYCRVCGPDRCSGRTAAAVSVGAERAQQLLCRSDTQRAVQNGVSLAGPALRAADHMQRHTAVERISACVLLYYSHFAYSFSFKSIFYYEFRPIQ